VAIAFHWDCRLLPETRSAFTHYSKGLKDAVASFRAQGWQVLGHSHPRCQRRLQRFWETLGVEWVETSADIFDRASVLVTDSPSLTAEFMSLDRPVLALNAPWYRREVSHGERFWDWPLHYIEDAPELAQTALEGLQSADWHPYAYADGKAAQRASDAILDLLCEPGSADSSRDVPRNGDRDRLHLVGPDL
jgi:CDP-glycerol glycerophosphotransferase (TagB/SpsB family)